LISVRSPTFSTFGYRSLSNAQQNGSISENHAAFHARGNASDAVSIPLQMLPKRMVLASQKESHAIA
jgi:hypothetical protein